MNILRNLIPELTHITNPVQKVLGFADVHLSHFVFICTKSNLSFVPFKYTGN